MITKQAYISAAPVLLPTSEGSFMLHLIITFIAREGAGEKAWKQLRQRKHFCPEGSTKDCFIALFDIGHIRLSTSIFVVLSAAILWFGKAYQCLTFLVRLWQGYCSYLLEHCFYWFGATYPVPFFGQWYQLSAVLRNFRFLPLQGNMHSWSYQIGAAPAIPRQDLNSWVYGHYIPHVATELWWRISQCPVITRVIGGSLSSHRHMLFVNFQRQNQVQIQEITCFVVSQSIRSIGNLWREVPAFQNRAARRFCILP